MEAKKCTICGTPLSGQKQKYCSNACKQKGHYYRVKSQTNTYFSQTVRSLRRKLDLIEMMGDSEEHNPELTFENVQKIISGASYRKR